MATRQNPSHIYKILPHASENPRYAFPLPLPPSHAFPPTEVDAKDGFVHMCPESLLRHVLTNYFTTTSRVMVLKIPYERLAGWKVVKWEGKSPDKMFPHLYGADLEAHYVESTHEMVQDEQKAKDQGLQSPWDVALARARQDGWLV